MRRRVSHLTCYGNPDDVLESEIRSNADGTLKTAFGFSSHWYFRNRGCVSVFYLNAISKILDHSIRGCSPWQRTDATRDSRSCSWPTRVVRNLRRCAREELPANGNPASRLRRLTKKAAGHRVKCMPQPALTPNSSLAHRNLVFEPSPAAKEEEPGKSRSKPIPQTESSFRQDSVLRIRSCAQHETLSNSLGKRTTNGLAPNCSVARP